MQIKVKTAQWLSLLLNIFQVSSKKSYNAVLINERRPGTQEIIYYILKNFLLWINRRRYKGK